MKKITKLFGLLLVAGAMLVGCKMEPNIDTNEIVLANGNWEMEYTAVETGTLEEGYPETTNMTVKATVSISGDEITFVSMSQGGTQIVTFPETATDTEIQIVKGFLEIYAATVGGTVTVDGKTITSTYPMRDCTEAEIAAMNIQKQKVSDWNDECTKNNGVIKTNRKKTEYNISYTSTSENSKGSTSYTIHLKKQK